MTKRKELGKIESVRVGFGGYDGAMLGVWFTFSGDAWGVSDGVGTWANRSESAKWSYADQMGTFADAMVLLRETLRDAKRTHAGELVGTPVEVTFEGNALKTWRVLTEVL